MEKVAWIMIWSLHVLYNWLIYQKIMFSLEKGPAQKRYMENSFWIFQHLNAGRNAPCNFIGWLKVNGPFCGHNICTLGNDTHACKQFVGLFVCLFVYFSWKSRCYFVFCICLVSLISNIQMKTCCWCFGSFFPVRVRDILCLSVFTWFYAGFDIKLFMYLRLRATINGDWDVSNCVFALVSCSKI